MTHSAGGYSPPQSDHSPNDPSTRQVAKQEASDVAHTAAQAGSHVGGTATEQGRRIAHETTQQARDLMTEGRDQLREQARQGQRKAVESLQGLADQLQQMSDRADDGLAPEIARQAADRTRSVASWLDNHEPGSLFDEVRSFARRKPGLFLAGAAVAGVVAGRLTRGAVAAAHGNDNAGGAHRGQSAPSPRPHSDHWPHSGPGQGTQGRGTHSMGTQGTGTQGTPTPGPGTYGTGTGMPGTGAPGTRTPGGAGAPGPGTGPGTPGTGTPGTAPGTGTQGAVPPPAGYGPGPATGSGYPVQPPEPGTYPGNQGR